MKVELRRIWFLGLLIVFVIATSMVYSELTGQQKVIEVKISYTDAENLTMKTALLQIISTSEQLENMAGNTSVELGMSMDEAIVLIEQAKNYTDRALLKLGEEILDQYIAIYEMMIRLNPAWVDPSLFRPEWFEDPADSDTYAEFARAQDIHASKQEDLHIYLEANRSMARVTYASRWVTPAGELVSNRTDILVREGDLWKFRELDT